jgi:hypothetical protein
MADNFQSKAVVKPPKAAKTVQVVKQGHNADAVSGESINATALAFIRAFKKARDKRE